MAIIIATLNDMPVSYPTHRSSPMGVGGSGNSILAVDSLLAVPVALFRLSAAQSALTLSLVESAEVVLSFGVRAIIQGVGHILSCNALQGLWCRSHWGIEFSHLRPRYHCTCLIASTDIGVRPASDLGS